MCCPWPCSFDIGLVIVRRCTKMKSCSKCNVSLEKGDKRWKFESAEAGGVPGKTGYLCSKCFHDVNKAKKANSESRTCVNCNAAFVKRRGRSSPETSGLCLKCFELVKANAKPPQSQTCVNCKAAFVKRRSNPEKSGLCPKCLELVKANAKPLEACLNCKTVFVKLKRKAGKGYCRKSKHACGIPPEAFNGKEGFLCYKCIPTVQKQFQVNMKKDPRSWGIEHSHSMKTRKKVVSVPLFYRETNKNMYRSKSRSQTKIKKPSGFQKKAMEEISVGKYKQAFDTLLGHSKNARQVFYKRARRYITEEIKAYPKQGILSKSPMFDYLKLIPWADIVEEASSSMPFLVHVLKAALPNPAKWENTKKQTLLGQKCLSAKQAKVIVDRRLGFLLSVILFSHKPIMFSFIQGCISVQLRKYNCGISLMRCLNGMGVAKGLHGTLMLIEALKRQKQSSESSSKEMAQDDQDDLVGASCSRAVDLQSLIFKERSDGELDDDIDMVEQLLGVTSMDF